MTKPDALTIRREVAGDGWIYRSVRGRLISDPRVVRRLNSMAVPPAYQDVRFARDARAHLQAVGRDAAGRLQYRYHPDWEKVRDLRKAQRLLSLVEVLPQIRRTVTAQLKGDVPSKELALAAIIELIALSAIRAGGEEYAKEHHTRGAATLLKSNVRCGDDDTLILSFRAKGGKPTRKEIRHAGLCAAVGRLGELPGTRLFQYRTADGAVHPASASDANAFLREIAGCAISLKDFRTLCGTAQAIETLASIEPAKSARARRRQILEAIRTAAQVLENTPAVCRKSYVHPAVVTAFEAGALREFAGKLKRAHSPHQVHAAVGAVLEAASQA